MKQSDGRSIVVTSRNSERTGNERRDELYPVVGQLEVEDEGQEWGDTSPEADACRTSDWVSRFGLSW